MTPISFRLTSWIARAVAACVAALTLASCGGGVSANPSPIVDSATITILPNTAVMYSGLPTTFVLSGGTGSYIIASSDQAVLQVSGGVTGRSVTLVPNNVTADTSVTLTVRDTGSATPVSATVTVRPGTVNNNVTITPSSTQSATCSPAICSGGDAEVKVTISQGGIPLAARGVRFEVLSGSFTFIPTNPTTSGVGTTVGTIEREGLGYITATDETGIARAQIRVTALAPNQTALLQVTDMATGAYRQTSFAIAQYTGNTPAFFTLPSSVTFTGPYANVCPTGGPSADVSVFGGTPPYTIAAGSSGSPGFTVSTPTVLHSGDRFTVTLVSSPAGVCLQSVPIGVTDATGRTITFTLSSVAGTGTAPAPAITLAPTSLVLRCSFDGPNPTPPPATIVVAVTSSLTVSGGTAPFFAGSNHPRVTVTVADRTVTVQRLNGDPTGTNYPATGQITVTDGTSTGPADFTVVMPTGPTTTSPAYNCP